MDNEEEKKLGGGKGFAGLSSMVSEVDDIVSSKPKQSQKAPSEPPPKQTADGSHQPKQTSTKPASQIYQAPAQPSRRSSAGKWFVGIAVVIGLIWLANPSGNSRPSKSAYSPGTSSTSKAPAGQPAIAQLQMPSLPSESKPSVGRNNVLAISQIRYCLAEKIRLDAAETVLNNYNDSDVDRFNEYVNDYNSRCGEFRYRQGSLESAQRDIEPYRSQLQADGRSRFVRSAPATARPSASTSVSKPARPAPDTMVLVIQRRLNELGYNAGTPDGLFGDKTRSAIKAFQRDQRIAATGNADQALLTRLRQATKRSKIGMTESVVTSPQSLPSTPEVQLPSTLSGGKPSLSTATSLEQEAIENACDYERRTLGSDEYYGCLKNELAALARSGGRPDLSSASPSEQAAIEKTCDFERRNLGPGEYYGCLRYELAALARSGGRPDLSSASPSEQAAIEKTCDFERRNLGPGEYYGCLRKELASLEYR